MSSISILNHARARRLLTATALACGVAITGSAAQATTQSDGLHDFLVDSYTGPTTGDFDVSRVNVTYDANTIQLVGVMDDVIGTSPNALYVWGVDRGHGTPFLFHQGEAHPIGEHVLFDAAIILSLNPDQDSFILDLDAAGHPTGNNTPLDRSFFRIEGNKITALIPRDFLRSTGFDIADYRYNLWPRTGLQGSSDVSDLAPNDSSIRGSQVAAVPEPATWGLMIMGFGLAGTVLRRRRVVAA